MKEKTGNTVKLIYDFNTSNNLEIFIPNLNGWYREISKNFRSSSYKRRTNGIDYFGPIFIYNTNKIIKENIPENCIVGFEYISSENKNKQSNRI